MTIFSQFSKGVIGQDHLGVKGRNGLRLPLVVWMETVSEDCVGSPSASRRRAGERVVPFHVERLDFRNRERHQFHKRLERNGQNL